MRLLIDTNVLLDVLMDRQPFVKDSDIVWKLCETGQVEGYMSALTFANMIYVMRKDLNSEKIEQVLKILSLFFRIAELSALELQKAADLKWDDYEDAIQSVTAERIQADYIITRNGKDFTNSRVPAITPAELITKIQNSL